MGDPDWKVDAGGVYTRLDSLEDRVGNVEGRCVGHSVDLIERISAVGREVAELRGRVAGYLVAASLLGVVVAFLAQIILGGGK